MIANLEARQATDRSRVDPGDEPFSNSDVPVLPSRGTLQPLLDELMDLDGALVACLVDCESCQVLEHRSEDPDLDIELAVTLNADIVRANRRAVETMGWGAAEDILITLGGQYHLIRPLEDMPFLFFYLVLDRSRGNLAMARHTLRRVEKALCSP